MSYKSSRIAFPNSHDSYRDQTSRKYFRKTKHGNDVK